MHAALRFDITDTDFKPVVNKFSLCETSRKTRTMNAAQQILEKKKTKLEREIYAFSSIFEYRTAPQIW